MKVNGHGITNDYCLAESVVNFTLVRSDGKVIECSRESSDSEGRELFGLCIGGYGLFGIIYEITLKVNDNFRVTMDSMMISLKEFPFVYESILKCEDVETKLARLDITNFEAVDLFVLRRASNTPTVSNLGLKPKEMSAMSRLLYKWAAGPLREV